MLLDRFANLLRRSLPYFDDQVVLFLFSQQTAPEFLLYAFHLEQGFLDHFSLFRRNGDVCYSQG